MRRAATKDDIIRTTQALIVRNGIRAVRVDEIAQTLGISKRTLYETFADKTELINSCLEDLSKQRKCEVIDYMGRQNFMPLQKIFWLLDLYIDGLQQADSNFLSDVEHKLIYAGHFEEDMRFWEQTLCSGLLRGLEEGYILPDTECDKIARQLLTTLYKQRLSDASDSEQRLFSRTLLRGISTQKGIHWIDERP